MAQMDWSEAEVLHKEAVIATINRAELGQGNVFYSIRIGRQAENDIKPTQYLRPSDMDDLEALCQDIRYWIQADIDDIRRKGQASGRKKKQENQSAPNSPDSSAE